MGRIFPCDAVWKRLAARSKFAASWRLKVPCHGLIFYSVIIRSAASLLVRRAQQPQDEM